MSQPAIIEVKRPNEVTPLAEVKRPQAGLEKTQVFKKKPAKWVFLVLFGVFFFFFVFFFLFFFFFFFFFWPVGWVFWVF